MRCRIAASLAALALTSGAASADPIAEFYKGKNINWILSAGAGGGYASYAHAFAPFLTAHIPGKPHIVIQNMPGAGGIRAMLYLNSVAPKDGTTIGLVHSSVPFAPLYGIRGANFDPRQMNWIGSITSAFGICVSWAKSGITKWEHMFEREFIVGGTGAGSQMETMPTMLKQLFGAKVKVISGYKGGNDVYLAMERGEVHGRCGGLVSSIKSTRPDWFPKKKIAVPIQIALQRDRGIPRQPGGHRIRQGRAHAADPGADPFAARNGPADPGAARHAAGAGCGPAQGVQRGDARSRLHRRGAAKQNIEIKEISGERVSRGAPPRLRDAAGGHQGGQEAMS